MEYAILRHVWKKRAHTYIHINDYLKSLAPNPSKQDFENIADALRSLISKEFLRSENGLFPVNALGHDAILENGQNPVFGDLDSLIFSVAITDKGIREIQQIDRENRDDLLTESTIQTNQSVRENVQSQKNFGTWSLILTGLSILFIGITAYLQYQDQTSAEVKALKNQVQESAQSLRQIRTSLERIDSSIQSFHDSLP